MMKIIIEAEQKLYMEAEVEVPDEIQKFSNHKISEWIDQNYDNFTWKDYDSGFNWTKWKESETA